MSTTNEDLLMEMYRVSALMKRSHMKGHHHGPHGPHGHGGPEGMPPLPPEDPKCPHAMGEDGPHGAKGHPELKGAHSHGPHGHGAPHPPIPGGPHGPGCKHKGAGKQGQKRILAMLAMNDGLSQKDLAFLLGIRPQSLTLALEKLEAEGYIERKQDSAKAGKEAAKEQAAERAKRADDVFAALTEKEKEQLATILAKVAATLEEGKCPHKKGEAKSPAKKGQKKGRKKA